MPKRPEPNGGSHAQDPTLSLSDSQILSAVDKRTPPPPPAPGPSRNADHSMWLGRVVVSEEFAPQGTKRKKRFLRAPMWMVIGAIVVGSSAGAGLYFVTHGGLKRGAEPTSSAGPVPPPAPAPAPTTPTPTPAVPPPSPAAPAAPVAETALTEAPKPAPKPTARKRTGKSAKAAASKKKSKKATAAAKKRKAVKSSRTRSR
jgi:type IV secretory pathway VirB10-like protein